MVPSPAANILIVDDDEEIQKFFADLVRILGATPLTANDGLAALEAVRATPPDLILLDVEMPRMDGLDTCRALKADLRTARIPVVMITSLSALDDRIRAIEAGADDFLTKPVHIAEFKARVRSLLRIKKLNDSLESAEDVVFTLARSIEAKDLYTKGHTERVTAYALKLGETVGLSKADLVSLRQGGVLHDIGKVAIPDHILNKPGRLTAEEFEQVKNHPTIGFNICSSMKSLGSSLPCIRWHHEKPNGNGYPDGLKGAGIPRVALIIAVADVYDALVSKRPYKEPMSEVQAVRILQEEADCGGLDAQLVSMFLCECLPK
jgi:putative two-component system response regulator